MSSGTPTLNRRGRQTREQILEAATLLMAERGYVGTTMAALGEASGLPKSAIYHYFGSKADLLAEVMGHVARRFFDDLRAKLEAAPVGGSPQERLTWSMESTADTVASHPDFLRLNLILILTNESAVVPDVGRHVERVRQEGRAFMRDMIDSAFTSAGEAGASVADDLAAFGVACFDGVFVESLARGRWFMAENVPLIAEAIAALSQARVGTRS